MFFRFLKVFISVFILTFAVLNSRFVIATVQYYWKKSEFKEHKASARLLPIAEAVTKRPLPNSANLVVDGVNVFAPIIFGVGDDNDVIYKNLEKGVVHYSNTPKPGEGGVSIILGHSSAYPWYRGSYGAVFALLSKLKAGDKVIVQYSDGRTFNYVVKRSIIFNPFSGDGRLKEIESSPRSTIVLVSCWPVGTNYRRIAVEAELI
ncbi:MAG: hypothetical protein A2750_03000 [Candidatus Yanofskybacteria bacterium RIFCSPHIGHO2_01_FULL_45_42]|uniref:Sortase n=3 Tax=Candidatus Yanofskyibacteriota TaxID=1752733 RepID=A0A1F8FLI1_9BACT|nr:MAG: hypothetical protein A2750_03000 [Candidatus Yanofskybacteria bacterium RIFCSPHIGHO2_01_FULL_45_42]OGN13580.1 MAG: hypothetical protein A3J47_02905 [Candidatus Yanofskybacteria bacterium RIFCSPHIGHO2_02_FULL_43_22]OGN31646.1 MAG: hypothetical protein A3J01_01960 [Candidatus Yanofskybacteria bacterium RIFCSPLOWO2_02_FULL_45_18]